MATKNQATNKANKDTGFTDAYSEVTEVVEPIKKSEPAKTKALGKPPVIRVEPTDKREVPMKLKMSQTKVNSAGQALQDRDGNLVTTDEDVENAVQIPGTIKYIKPYLLKSGSGLNTGLNFMIDNPYSDEQVYHPQWGERVLQGKPKALLQNILEYKHGKDFDYYTNRLMDRIYPSDKVSEIPFFASPLSQIPMDGSVLFLNLANPVHEIWYYMMRVHPEVANSYQELDTNQEAWYYMVDDQEVHAIKTDKKRKFNLAVAALEEVYNQGTDTIIKWAMALENNDIDLSRDKAYDWLDSYFRRNQVAYARFLKYYELYKDAGRRAAFFAAADVQEYINKQIVRVRDGKYYWIKPETDGSPMRTFEWTSKERFIYDFLLAPEYGDEVEILQSIAKSRS